MFRSLGIRRHLCPRPDFCFPTHSMAGFGHHGLCSFCGGWSVPWGWGPCRDRALLREVLNWDSHPQEKGCSPSGKIFWGRYRRFRRRYLKGGNHCLSFESPILVYDLPISGTSWQGLLLVGLGGLRLMETFAPSSACWVSSVAGLLDVRSGES